MNTMTPTPLYIPAYAIYSHDPRTHREGYKPESAQS